MDTNVASLDEMSKLIFMTKNEKPNTKIVFVQHGDRSEWEDEWKEVRRSGIGGSDIGAILGLSKWRGPIEVYMSKIGTLKERGTSFKAMCGTILEDLIRDTTQKLLSQEFRVNVEIEQLPFTYRSTVEGYEFMLANIDGEVKSLPGKDGPGLFEAKTASVYFTDDWVDGSVPMVYIAQMQWYMGILGYKWGVISYSIDNREPEYTFVDFDQELFDMMKEKSKAFWYENVLEKELPSPIGLTSCQNMIEQIYPSINKDDSRDINDITLAKLLEERDYASSKEKEFKKGKDRLTQEIELMLGETGKAKCFDWNISYYEVNRTSVDAKKLKKDHPEIYKELVRESKYRVVRATKK